MHQHTRTTLIALLSALVLLAAACNGSSAEAEDLNDADITFLQGMVPHHDQAVEMAELVPDRTDRQELNQLADEIIAAQESEIDEMEQFLDGTGAEADRDMDMNGMDGDMGGMEGMMSAAEMQRLAGLNGVEFDLAFIDMMIAHHEGAITSAERVLDEGESPQVTDLAERIIDGQEAEIDQMTTWREEWADEAAS